MGKASKEKKVRTSGVQQEQKNEIVHFFVPGLLPPGHSLALNTRYGTLSRLLCKQDHPYIVQQLPFSASETSLLLPLLEAYPFYCPYETLVTSFNGAHLTEATIEYHRKRLQEIQKVGAWEQELRPLRNALSRTRLKLRLFDIEISSILETGYILRPVARGAHGKS